jgi:APA family basic amino acid/polyamine antiporter
MTENQTNQISLVRGIGLIAAISINVGNIIGTGVFLKARVMTCNLGSPEWVMLAWIAAGILSLAGALTYAELSAMKPQAGGEYVFLRDSFGKVWGFLFGWMRLSVAQTGSQAAVAVAFAIGLNDFYGGTLKKTLLQTELFGSAFEISTLQIIAVSLIFVFTLINCASVFLTGQLATILTFVKIGLILFVGIGAFVWVTGGDFGHFSLLSNNGTCEGVDESIKYGSPNYSVFQGFAAAMLAALWGYDGWNNLSSVAGEVKNPNRNLPLAIIGGTVLIIILYLFVHIAYFYVLDPTTIASVSKDSSVAKEVVSRFFGGGAGNVAAGVAVSIFTIGLMLSSIGTLHTSLLAGARYPYAMAKDGVMFDSLSKLSNRSKVPVIALIVQGIWASILALSGSFDTLTDYVIFGSWIFYALATATIFVFRQKYPNAERPYKAFGYPVVPVLFLLVAGWLLITTMKSSPTQSFAGIFLILLGLPIYYYLGSKKKGNSEE